MFCLDFVISPVVRQGRLPEIMQTTITASQPYTSHVTLSRQVSASIWGIPTLTTRKKMQPARIFVDLDIADAVFTTVLLLAILFSLAWIIYLQELLDEWFFDVL